MSSVDYLKKNIFTKYDEFIQSGHCKKCLDYDRMYETKDRTRIKYSSFWHIGEQFLTSNIKIAFVGMLNWMDPILFEDKEYVGEFWDVTNYTYNPDVGYDEFGNSSRGKKFWNVVRDTTRKVFSLPEDTLDFLNYIYISNLSKCSIKIGDTNSHNNTELDYFIKCRHIFEEEIKFIKPTHLIYLVGKRYDDDIIKNLNFYYSKSNDVFNEKVKIKKKDGTYSNVIWWHKTYSDKNKPKMHVLRTMHPYNAPKHLPDRISDWIITNKS